MGLLKSCWGNGEVFVFCFLFFGCEGQVKGKSGQGSEIEYFFQENSTKGEDLARG